MSLERLRQGLLGKGSVVLTLPVFNRLMRSDEGFHPVLEFMREATETDVREKEIKTTEGEIKISRWVNSIEFSIDFLNGEELAAEFKGNYLKIYRKNLPQTALALSIGKKLKDVIALPRLMTDFSEYEILGMWNESQNVTIEINAGRMRMDSRTADMVIHQIQQQIKESRIENDTNKGWPSFS